MKRYLLGSTIACFAATAAFANVTIQDLDATGDGFASYAEVKNAIPGMDMVDFDAIDTNNDNRLSANEVNVAEAQSRLATHSIVAMKFRALRNLDSDGDGFISWGDMARVYPSMTKLSFDGVDKNGDGRLSYSEYYDTDTQTAIAQCEASTFKDLASLDTNGDNFLNMDELKGGYPNASASDFRTIDLNRDNRISAIELLAPTAECLKN